MLSSIKGALLATPFATMFLVFRDRVSLAYTALFHPSIAGTVANDQLAMHLVVRMCEPGRTFIDVGAHIGSVGASVQHHVPKASLIAIEAIPEKATRLRRLLRTAVVHQVALGSTTGQVKFFVNTKQSGYSSLLRPSSDQIDNFVEISVPMSTLDRLVAGDTIDVIKIDVEGSELEVLKGSTELLARNRPIIMFESAPSPNDQTESDKSALWKFFEDTGYLVLVPNRLAHNDDGLTRAGFVESHLYPRRATNYFGVPRERQVEYRERARRLLLSSA